MAACVDPTHRLELFWNVVIHALILLVIVSSFYFMYVSHLSTTVYKNEVNTLITNAIKPALKELKKVDPSLASFVQNTNLTRLADHYETTPTLATGIQNGWLQSVTVIIIVFLIAILMVALFIPRETFGVCIWSTLLKVIAENIIVFLFVGAIEVCFFLFVAKRYVPVVPSLMMQSTFDDVKGVVRAARASPELK
jgi:hypothetical protein